MKICTKGLRNFSLFSSLQCYRFLLSVSVFFTLSLSNTVIAQSVNVFTVSDIDKATSQWLNIERQTNELKADWKEQSPLLKQRLILLKAEKKQLNKLLSMNNESGNDVEIKRAELLTEQTRIEQQQEKMTESLNLLNYTKNNITPLLPPTLKQQWQSEQVLKEEHNNTKTLQSVLAQLTQLAEFNQRISTHESTIEIGDEKSILVQQLFLGASTAWFVTRDGQYTGWGKADSEGWKWHVDETINADSIKQAIAIFQKKRSSDWVTLPIHLATAIEQRDGSALGSSVSEHSILDNTGVESTISSSSIPNHSLVNSSDHTLINNTGGVL